MIEKTHFSAVSELFRPVVFAASLAIVAGFSPSNAQDRSYGYYEVVDAQSLNIRSRPYMTSEVLGVAPRGATLIKWKRFCSLRPWCPVQYGEVRGWAGKAFLAEFDDE